MYIARKKTGMRTTYCLRETIEENGVLKSRDLFDLGSSPADYLIYPDNGNAFYVHEDLCDHLYDMGVEPDNDELERVFFPFLLG
jgi:hypothetical protein